MLAAILPETANVCDLSLTALEAHAPCRQESSNMWLATASLSRPSRLEPGSNRGMFCLCGTRHCLMIFVGRALTSCTEREGGTAKGRDGRRKRERRKRGGEDARDQARQGTQRSLLHMYIHTCIYTYIILINIDYFFKLVQITLPSPGA